MSNDESPTLILTIDDLLDPRATKIAREHCLDVTVAVSQYIDLWEEIMLGNKGRLPNELDIRRIAYATMVCYEYTKRDVYSTRVNESIRIPGENQPPIDYINYPRAGTSEDFERNAQYFSKMLEDLCQEWIEPDENLSSS